MSVNNNATGLNSARKSTCIKKSKLLDLGRYIILPISRKVCTICVAKHNHFNTHLRPFKRHGGKRGGRRKQRKIKVQLTQRFLSPSTIFFIFKSQLRKFTDDCDTELVKQNTTKIISQDQLHKCTVVQKQNGGNFRRCCS